MVTFTAVAAATAPDARLLEGRWRVDLRPEPGADEYFQEFVVSGVDGTSFEGRFYGTAIGNGTLNVDWGEVHFAFTTRDDSGEYHTSGRLDGNVLRGTTHSIGREFLAVWSAERIE